MGPEMLPREPGFWTELKKQWIRGIIILDVTQCSRGSVEMGHV